MAAPSVISSVFAEALYVFLASGFPCRLDLIIETPPQISRAPDVVLYPQSHEEVEKIVVLASKHQVDIVPYGGTSSCIAAYRHTTHDALWSPSPSLLIHHCYPGGTNIVGATEPTPVVKDRSICSLDMRRMNRVLSLDKAAHTAVIEAGALGPDLEEQLHKEGFSLGHDPDSFEYSTLGAPPSHACRCPPHTVCSAHCGLHSLCRARRA